MDKNLFQKNSAESNNLKKSRNFGQNAFTGTDSGSLSSGLSRGSIQPVSKEALMVYQEAKAMSENFAANFTPIAVQQAQNTS